MVGYAESYDEKEKRYRGLIIGAAVNNPVADGRSVLVKPEVAVAQEAEHQTDADADGGGRQVLAATVAAPSRVEPSWFARSRPTSTGGRPSTPPGSDATTARSQMSLSPTLSLSQALTSR